jgi:N-acetylneuraminic acid mutarotase
MHWSLLSVAAPAASWRDISAMVAVQGGIYTFGLATTTPAHPSPANAFVYRLSAHAWTTIAHSRWQHGAGAAAPATNGVIYVMAGEDLGQTGNNELEEYDPRTNSWRTRAAMPLFVTFPAATTGPDGRIYVLGGVLLRFHSSQVHAAVTNAVEIYDPRINHWSLGAPMPTARAGLAAVTGTDGYIYAIGGTSSAIDWDATLRALSVVERYSPTTNRWMKVASIPIARYLLAAVMAPDGKIYAIGGTSDNYHKVATVATYAVAQFSSCSTGKP